MEVIVDTSFLIGLWREPRQGKEILWIRRNPEKVLLLLWIVKAEFLRGARIVRHDTTQIEEFLGRFVTVWPTEKTIQIYAAQFALLRKNNRQIGSFDLWIAAAALEHGKSLLTHNQKEFQRIPRLVLEPLDD
ncbi:type II toxin-antitoxin system VapC family toxin [Oscillatoria laete-virens NRMC-F 0139]|nr:type II toxin-antitoxin system VapC family toxin [Oscillatoria laete-virens NRMC-F 0139]